MINAHAAMQRNEHHGPLCDAATLEAGGDGCLLRGRRIGQNQARLGSQVLHFPYGEEQAPSGPGIKSPPTVGIRRGSIMRISGITTRRVGHSHATFLTDLEQQQPTQARQGFYCCTIVVASIPLPVGGGQAASACGAGHSFVYMDESYDDGTGTIWGVGCAPEPSGIEARLRIGPKPASYRDRDRQGSAAPPAAGRSRRLGKQHRMVIRREQLLRCARRTRLASAFRG